MTRRQSWASQGCLGGGDGASDCPCSVREQPPTPTESNQEHAGNLLELSEVTDASWSLSLPEADYESVALPTELGWRMNEVGYLPGRMLPCKGALRQRCVNLLRQRRLRQGERWDGLTGGVLLAAEHCCDLRRPP